MSRRYLSVLGLEALLIWSFGVEDANSDEWRVELCVPCVLECDEGQMSYPLEEIKPLKNNRGSEKNKVFR